MSDQLITEVLRAAARHPHKGPNDTDWSMLRAAATRLDGGYEAGGSNTRQTVARVCRAVADILDAAAYRPRVAFTHGSIAKLVTARRRYVCGNHLSGVVKHYIEPGQQHIHNALPPHNSEIGNENWWHLRVCLDCCPAEHDHRQTGAAR